MAYRGTLRWWCPWRLEVLPTSGEIMMRQVSLGTGRSPSAQVIPMGLSLSFRATLVVQETVLAIWKSLHRLGTAWTSTGARMLPPGPGMDHSPLRMSELIG